MSTPGVTDEMVEAALDAYFEVFALPNSSVAETMQAALAAVVPMIRAQEWAAALEEAYHAVAALTDADGPKHYAPDEFATEREQRWWGRGLFAAQKRIRALAAKEPA